MVNLNRLHCFFVCAQTKQVTRAANILGVTQPSLSQQIKSFEEELGFDLFVRAAKTIELTPKGRALYERSIELFSSVEAISDFIESRKPIEYPKFTFGVSDEIERPFVAEIVGKLLKFKKTKPKQFQISSRSHSEIVEKFKSGKIDLLLTCKPIAKLKPEAVYEFPVHLVTSKNHDKFFVRDENIKATLASLQESLVLPSSDLPLRSEIDQFLKDNELQFPVIFESNILACTVRAIREGVGCGFLPLPYILSDYKKNLLSVFGPPKGYWQQNIYLYKAEKTDESLVDNFQQLINTYL